MSMGNQQPSILELSMKVQRLSVLRSRIQVYGIRNSENPIFGL